MKYNIVKTEKDNIPGFRDRWTVVVESFDTKEEAEKVLQKYKNSSNPHGGWGAGSGSVDTTYFIEEKPK
jgi:hypothetical protein